MSGGKKDQQCQDSREGQQIVTEVSPLSEDPGAPCLLSGYQGRGLHTLASWGSGEMSEP